ncbi:MAG TPA: hypothetical protein VGW39_12295 [Chthoniobacterales bacterium]|nr:hypothetical protein [Chthoniobacterales bacterium]
MKTPKNKDTSFDPGRCGKSKRAKRPARAFTALLAASASVAWCLFAMSNPVPIMNPSKPVTLTDAPTVTPFVDIGAAVGPLTHVYIGEDLSCQVAHILDGTTHEFFPPNTVPGDCGTFIALGGTNGTLYTPDFTAHGNTATSFPGVPVVFTPISQVRTGTGTAADPNKAVTLVSLPATALSIRQTDTYSVGDKFYRTEIVIINGGGPADGVLYRAGDAYLAKSDSGFGLTEDFGNRHSVGCSAQPNNVPPGRTEEWIPFTGNNNFFEGTYSTVWDLIGMKGPFPSTCACPFLRDNGAGISWTFSIPAGGSTTFTHFTNFATPCPGTVFDQNFDGPLPGVPGLPPGWVATPVGSWVTSITSPDTAPNDAFVQAPATVSDKYLDTPGIVIGSSSALVSFRHRVNLESTFDGGVLEVSSPNIAGGAFTDILLPQVGGTFITGGYNAEISSITGSPIAGRMAWSGSSCGYFCTVANLGPIVNGQTIKLRFRMASDNGGTGPSDWRIDTIQVLSSGAVCGPCVPATLSPAKLLNISTRAFVGTGGDVLISGFIITGDAPKNVAIRGLGPSLNLFGIGDALADPTLELRDCNGTILLSNDNWQDNPTQAGQLIAAGLALNDDLEAGLIGILPSGASYTVILAGRNGGTGIGLLEIYDLDQAADSQLANISSRGLVQTGNKVMIAGFILGGAGTRVAVRGIGPSFGPGFLADPFLKLGGSQNDNWQVPPLPASELISRNLALPHPLEAGIFTTLSPGPFTAILEGKNGGMGVGLVEIYNVH